MYAIKDKYGNYYGDSDNTYKTRADAQKVLRVLNGDKNSLISRPLCANSGYHIVKI